MKKEYTPIVAMKIPFDKSSNVVTEGSTSCWAVITNKIGGGVCTTEEPGHVNEWFDDGDPSFQFC